MNPRKRQRGSNFTSFEKSLFVDLVAKYISAIENKQTGGMTLKQKEAAWEQLTSDFNCSPNVNKRNVKQMKSFYDNFKRKSKKTYADERMERVKTGEYNSSNDIIIPLTEEGLELDCHVTENENLLTSEVLIMPGPSTRQSPPVPMSSLQEPQISTPSAALTSLQEPQISTPSAALTSLQEPQISTPSAWNRASLKRKESH
ncbi:hypothetical protein C0J52_22045, partial [Blattella germanica]